MDKIDDLKTELKAMERIAKILHDLPNPDSVIRVAAWLQEVTRTESYPEDEAPTFAVIEKQLESLPHSELTHLRAVINHLIGTEPKELQVLPPVAGAMLPQTEPAPEVPHANVASSK